MMVFAGTAVGAPQALAMPPVPGRQSSLAPSLVLECRGPLQPLTSCPRDSRMAWKDEGTRERQEVGKKPMAIHVCDSLGEVAAKVGISWCFTEATHAG